MPNYKSISTNLSTIKTAAVAILPYAHTSAVHIIHVFARITYTATHTHIQVVSYGVFIIFFVCEFQVKYKNIYQGKNRIPVDIYIIIITIINNKILFFLLPIVSRCVQRNPIICQCLQGSYA
jgi:hypothetical protein